MADNEQDEYMDKDIFDNGIPQAIFLEKISREEQETSKTFELSSIGNVFPGRKVFFDLLAISYETLTI